MNFAIIYNPKTQKTQYYLESKYESFDLSIQNFQSTAEFFFQSIDEKGLEDNILLENEYIIPSSTDKKDYVIWVNRIKNNIYSKQLVKGVAACKLIYKNEMGVVNSKLIFQELVKTFPQTFVYCFYFKNQLWIGASPEVIGILEDNLFTSVSLAGTRTDNQFREKEREEQHIVKEIIERQLNTYNSKIDTGVTTIFQFGKINHLINEHKIKVGAHFDFKKMIEEIHPSPALSGYPKDSSKQLILDYEGMDREFYCGLVHQKMDSSHQYSFALIRCAKITKSYIEYFAGAGITEDSNPEEEWQEVMDKIAILKEKIEKL